jgi:hypothetical protein
MRIRVELDTFAEIVERAQQLSKEARKMKLAFISTNGSRDFRPLYHHEKYLIVQSLEEMRNLIENSSIFR